VSTKHKTSLNGAQSAPTAQRTMAGSRIQRTTPVLVLTEPLNPAMSLAERISRRAYSIWLEHGCREGHALEDRLQAEAEILTAIQKTHA
jgi:DUF2934 family protein